MMFDALTRLREKFYEVQKQLPVDSPESLALAEAIDEIDDAMVMDVRAQTYAKDNPVFTYCQESR